MPHDAHETAFVALAIEQWKLLRLYHRAIAAMPPDKQRRAEAQWLYATEKLQSLSRENGVRLIEYEGEQYSPNLPLLVINAEEFDSNEGLLIDCTLEPAVLHDGRITHMGRVTVTKKEQ